MRRVRTTLGALAGVLVLAGCGGGAEDGGQEAPAPTVTVTVTETATPDASALAEEPTPSPTAAETGAATATDPCEAAGLDGHAFIFVTHPTSGAQLASGDEVTGCSNTYEASFQYELLDRDGAVLDEGFGTASCGTGCVGDLSFTVTFDVAEETVGTLRVFATSAQDGSEELVNAIPVRLTP